MKRILSICLVSIFTTTVFAQQSVVTTLPACAELSQTDAEEIIRQQAEDKKQRETALLVNRYPFQVLDRKEIQRGNRKLIFNRVVPPDLPQVLVESSGSLSSPPREPTAEEVAAWQNWREKEQFTIMLSTTVYDHRITELRWRHKGRDYLAWSSIDFNYLRGVSNFETEDASYFFLLGIGNATAEELKTNNRLMKEAGVEGYVPKVIPDFEGFTPGKAEYFVEADGAADALDAAAFVGIDALHDYYAENARQLQINYRNQEKLNAARKDYQLAHPETEKDQVLTFWMLNTASSQIEVR